MSTQIDMQLSQIKIKCIERIIAEHSLDTLRSWLDMYEEARYVASLYSNEEELIKFRIEYEESIKKGFCHNK